VKRCVAGFALAGLVGALLLPTLALATDGGDHPGCGCPKGACFCSHGAARAGNGHGCARGARIEAMGCGSRPAGDARFAPLLPDGVLGRDLLLRRSAGEAASPVPGVTRTVERSRAVDPPPPKA
jgi:hypothetical protein